VIDVDYNDALPKGVSLTTLSPLRTLRRAELQRVRDSARTARHRPGT